MPKYIPHYKLHDFKDRQSDFYCNYLNPHVKGHAFTNLPHKHDFYLVMLVTGGSGWHEIDFVRYPVKPGSVFLMQPGQMHYWHLSDTINGYVFFHSTEFFEQGFSRAGIRDFSFYKSFRAKPALNLSKIRQQKLLVWLEELMHEYNHGGIKSSQKVHALITLVYVELCRDYAKPDVVQHTAYMDKIHEFEALIEDNFRSVKLAGDYAAMLHISAKHLNRIVQECLGTTSTQLITNRVVLEARRLLIHAKLNVSQIAAELGYADASYFVRIFKKHTGETPGGFLSRYQERK